MCGIYGILDLTGAPVDPDLLSVMGRATRHRGPDDEGWHADGECAIGMRRLSIIDLSGGHQPISSGDDMLWVVCNGEIYNFRELRSELEALDCVFKTRSDSEVVLHGYAQWGEQFVQRLNGMYAFAIWDGLHRRLVIGRDRLGIKPIYVFNDGRRLVFASEAKAILALPDVGAALDPEALSAYLHLGYVPAPLSIFRGISKLPPATIMTAEGGQVEQRRYWRIPSQVDRNVSEDEWVGRISDRLRESVNLQMVSDVPIGAFLSGGVDSSSVVAYMSQISDRPIKTYAIGFEGGTAERLYNELPYARRVAQLFHTDHHEILVRPDVVSLLPKLAWHLDEPIADTAFITTFLVSEFARRDVTVILSGVGGDELFGGYRRYLGSYYQGGLARLPSWATRAAAAVSGRLPSDRHSPLLNYSRLAKGFLASAALPFEDRYRSYIQVFSRQEVAALAGIDDVVRHDAVDAAFRIAACDDDLNRLLVVDAETQLPDDLLLLTDRMTMATSLECRVPLLDHELVEIAARIPKRVKVRGGQLKYAMKRALHGVLPNDILKRRKRGFGVPMGAWLKAELKPVLHHLLGKQAVRAREWFRHDPIAELIADHDANRVDGTDKLLALLNLELWACLYLDGRSPDDLALELKALA